MRREAPLYERAALHLSARTGWTRAEVMSLTARHLVRALKGLS